MITPDSAEWKELQTTEEMILASQIPSDQLAHLSTRTLVNTILDNPFLMQFMVYDTCQTAIKVFREDFNVYSELYQRDDCLPVLVETYENLGYDVDNSFVENLRPVLAEILIMDQFNEEGYAREDAELFQRFKETYSKNVSYKEEHREKFSSFEDGVCNYLKNPDLSFPDEYMASIASISPFVILNEGVFFTTPNGTGVYAHIIQEMTASEISGLDGYMDYLFPNAYRVSSSTRHYDCHSFAWYSQNTNTNIYWIYHPYEAAYWGDGSYTASSIGTNRKVGYNSGEHSAIVAAYSSTGAYPTRFLSKWNDAGLYLHSPNYGPDFHYSQGVTYYQ